MACGWDLDYSSCEADDRDKKFLSELAPELKELVEDMATDLLSRWTGGVFGPCPYVIRPCRNATDHGRSLREFTAASTRRTAGATWSSVVIEGRPYALGCGQCGSRCACVDGVRALDLPWPVHSILRVEIDGETVPAEAYRVDEGRRLVRQDGGTWPLTQDLLAAPGEPDTFVIEYERGLPVPAGGRVAAGALAMEFAKAMCNDSSCRLPERLQTVSRQGVTVTMLDGFEDLAEGRTGIWIVDSWVASVVNPPRPATVRSVDVPRRRGGVYAPR